MKLVIALFFLTPMFVTAADCVDLSFSTKVASTKVDYRQIGCEKFHLTFYTPEGEAYSEFETFFGDDFTLTEVDDAYEKYSNSQRWMWSRDKQTLIHEATIDSIDKNTQVKTFRSLSELITLDPSGQIKRTAYEMVRREEADAIVRVEQKSESSLFDALR